MSDSRVLSLEKVLIRCWSSGRQQGVDRERIPHATSIPSPSSSGGSCLSEWKRLDEKRSLPSSSSRHCSGSACISLHIVRNDKLLISLTRHVLKPRDTRFSLLDSTEEPCITAAANPNRHTPPSQTPCMSRLPILTPSRSVNTPESNDMLPMSPAADTRKKQSKRDEVSDGFDHGSF